MIKSWSLMIRPLILWAEDPSHQVIVHKVGVINEGLGVEVCNIPPWVYLSGRLVPLGGRLLDRLARLTSSHVWWDV